MSSDDQSARRWTIRCENGEVHATCDDEQDADLQLLLMAPWLGCGPHYIGEAVDVVT